MCKSSTFVSVVMKLLCFQYGEYFGVERGTCVGAVSQSGAVASGEDTHWCRFILKDCSPGKRLMLEQEKSVRRKYVMNWPQSPFLILLG